MSLESRLTNVVVLNCLILRLRWFVESMQNIHESERQGFSLPRLFPQCPTAFKQDVMHFVGRWPAGSVGVLSKPPIE